MLFPPQLWSQFVAFNDHAPGAGTSSNTTTWNALGDSPGSSGLLKNIATGTNLPVTLTITRTTTGVGSSSTQGTPAAGTPLYAAFNGFVNFQGTPNCALELTAGGVITYTLTGLNPNKRYSFMGSAVRGNDAYTDRWTLFEIVGAASFTNAHTTKALTTARVPSITDNQAAINTGANGNPSTGDMAAWGNIDSGADGIFTVTCQQYTGPVPGGSSAGSKGYGMTGMRLEEFDVVLTPALIVTQPTSQTINEMQPVTFTVAAKGNPPPSFQWYRNDDTIGGATNASYTIDAAPFSYDGAVFKAAVFNKIANTNYTQTSSNAVLRVVADTTAPVLLDVRALAEDQLRVTFSERVSPDTATNLVNYSIASASGSLRLSAAMLEDTRTSVLLTIAPLTENVAFTLAVTGVRDLSAAGNLIATDTRKAFTLVKYAPVAIGNPALAGEITAVSSGYDLAGSGTDIGGTKDQFEFAYQEQTGNFDFRVRLAELSVTDPYVKAGLMVRETLQDSSRFAAIFASSAQLGCFFESRSTAAMTAALTGPTLKFPANYPWAWLRLRRNGNELTGFAGFDGKAWQQLGTMTLAIPTTVLFGMAVTSDATNAVAMAKFRDLGPTANPTILAYKPKRESLGPSNRRTGVIFSEIMYHPRPRPDGKNLAFIEIYNGEPIFTDFTGWTITGGIEFAFPDGFRLQAGQLAVIAADPQGVHLAYGIEGVLGPYQGSLSHKQDTLRLLNHANAVRAELTYSTEPPWPASADGAGHSLVCFKPSYGEEDPRAWDASELIGGSPGFDDPIVPHRWTGVVISEFLAAPQAPDSAFIELYNAAGSAVDLSGCFLTDSTETNKYRLPDGANLNAQGRIAFTQALLGFGLNPSGGTVYLVGADQSRVLDAIRFGAQEQGVSSGRFPDAGPVIRRLSDPTPGLRNAAPRQEDVVINELMYNPITGDDDDQYIELYNRAANAVDLSGWQFTDGVSFTFPTGQSIPAGGYLVVARNLQRMLASYPQLSAANTVGDFTGRLSAGGEHVALAKPAKHGSDTVYVQVSEVTYQTGGRWPELADGGGSSLELKDAHSDLSQASNWAASDETQKAAWASYEVTAKLDLANQTQAANRLYVISRGETECLLDDIEVFKLGGTNLLNNPGFEKGQTNWTFYGTHITSSVETSGAFSGVNCLHLRSLEVGDEGPNSIRANLVSSIAANTMVTIRAKARWLSGWPETLLRVRGNGIELPIKLQVPSNLGTPGLPNSRRVDNAGPAISDVTHYPPVPAVNQSVLVTARISDPDGLSVPQVIYRLDPSTSTSIVSMRDDGTGGDAMAGDGIYTATIPGRGSGLAAFRIGALDAAAVPAGSTFPANAPTRECLIRWADPTPFGSFAHYHLWSTAASTSDLTSKSGLDRKYRDCTIVYNTRTIYNAGWRNKGSPFHSGLGSYSASFPDDDMFLGSGRHVFRSTGNGSDESTEMAGDVAYWMSGQLGLPFSHSHYVRLYRNGTLHYPLDYDIEIPDRAFARDWRGGGGLDDTLYKISGWFEYDDGNANGPGSLVWATLQKKPTTAPPYKVAAYRFNWLPHPGGRTANDYSLIINLVAAANATDRVTQLMNLADMEEWMRTFALRRAVGDWDSWSYNTGQNMYLYAPLGERAVLMSWDMDFVLGYGDPASTSQLFTAGEDSVVNALFAVPTYRRMMWRAYQDAVNGPMQKVTSDEQFDSRRAALLKNGVSSTTPTALKNYVSSRRTFLQTQIKNADAKSFSVTSQDFTTSAPTATITGIAPFGVASIEINGTPYPVSWTGNTLWNVKVPLPAATNVLRVVGKDLRGNAYAGATGQVTITYTAPAPQAQDWVMINEIMYRALSKDAEFVELFNRQAACAFDLSGVKLEGADFAFAPGTFIQPNGYLVVAKNSAAFAAAFGATIPVAGEYSGTLRRGGEALRLVRPGATEDKDVIIDEVHYENTQPWPAEADGFGPSLQLLDSSQDNWRAANWGVTATNDVNRATPGRANANRASLEPFPDLWINEVLCANEAGQVDSRGEHDPWIELHNSSPFTIDLTPYYLSNDSSNLTRWRFPAGTTLQPGGFLLIWADGQPDQSQSGEPHTDFRVDETGGFVGLSRFQSGLAAAMDYVNCPVTAPDRSVGDVPDGNPRTRRLMSIPTPGGPNNPASMVVPVFVNEWMSANSSFLSDPASGNPEDWFELYNGAANTVDLAGYFLTDDLNESTKFQIPSAFPIGPQDYLLVWADGQNAANTSDPAALHVSFKLAKAGGRISLLTPNGGIIDSVAYGPQAENASAGRYPDAGPVIFTFTVPTPGAPNTPEVPRFSGVSFNGPQMTLRWTAISGGGYQVEFTDTLDQSAWTPLDDTITATGTDLSANVSWTESAHRFFRIVRVR